MEQVNVNEKDKVIRLAETRKIKIKPYEILGYTLLALGLILSALAIYYYHNVAAITGIALTFWGALLFYIRPTRFIRKEILDSTIIEFSETYNKLIEELGYEGKPLYISPSTLWGSRNAVLYIPRSNQIILPTGEQLSAQEVLMKNPGAIKLTPPGLGLSRLIESELKTNFSTVNLKYLQYSLEKALVDDLEIVESFKMEISEPKVRVEMKASIFDQVIQGKNAEEGNRLIDDPLNSAIACIIARSTRKPVEIERIQIEPKERTIKTDFMILEQSE